MTDFWAKLWEQPKQHSDKVEWVLKTGKNKTNNITNMKRFNTNLNDIREATKQL